MVDEKSGVHLNPEELNDTLDLPEDDLPTPKLGGASPERSGMEGQPNFGESVNRSVYVVRFSHEVM